MHTSHTLVLALSLVLVASGFAEAQKVGPSHCFQVASSIDARLASFAGDGAIPADPGAAAIKDRSPRHCYFKTLELFGAVQSLRKSKGAPALDLPPVPSEELTPAHVHELAQATLLALDSLQYAFRGAKPPPLIPFVEGKKPSDVYAMLARCELRLAKLGTTFGPSDCYREAGLLERELEVLSAARQVKVTAPPATGLAGKKPADCYAAAHELFAALAPLSKDIPIQAPAARTGELKPAHVLDLLSQALADIHALRIAAGRKDSLRLPELVAGKAPGDVLGRIERAQVLVKGLAAAR